MDTFTFNKMLLDAFEKHKHNIVTIRLYHADVKNGVVDMKGGRKTLSKYEDWCFEWNYLDGNLVNRIYYDKGVVVDNEEVKQ